MEKIIVILGPTCTGKTSLAEDLCLRYSGEIISADSRQVCRYMDVGTGKLPKSENVVTHLQDVVLPNQEYSVAHWVESAKRVMAGIWQKGKVPFVVGGTGFYIDVFLGLRQTAGIAPDYSLRTKLEKLSTGELFEMLQKKDPERAGVVDKHNRRRLVRALEVITNYKLRITNDKNNPSFDFVPIGLKASNDFLYQRADQWVEKILEDEELLKETADLIEKGYKGTPPLQGLIYKTVLDYLDHILDYEEMKQKIKYDLHGYIRRQLTWFKKSPPNIEWFDISKPDCGQKVANVVEFYLDG